MITRLTEDARKALLASAADEARQRGDRRIGTDHILLGLLRDPASEAAWVIRVDLETARATQRDLDRTALASIGIKTEDVGPATQAPVARRLPPLTSGSRDVLRRALEESRPTKTSRIGTRDFLAAILALQRPDPAAELLFALDVDVPEALERLARLSADQGN